MKKIRLGPNFTVFAIFFGVAVLESFASRNILWIAFWIVLAVLFIASDNLRTRT